GCLCDDVVVDAALAEGECLVPIVGDLLVICGGERDRYRAMPGQVECSVGECGDVEDVLLVVDDRANRSGAGIGFTGIDVDLPLAHGDRVSIGRAAWRAAV